MTFSPILSLKRTYRRQVLDSANPLALSDAPGPLKSARGLAQSKTLARGAWSPWAISRSWGLIINTRFETLLGLALTVCTCSPSVNAADSPASTRFSFRHHYSDLDICSKLWRPRKDNANEGRNHAGFLENLRIRKPAR